MKVLHGLNFVLEGTLSTLNCAVLESRLCGVLSRCHVRQSQVKKAVAFYDICSLGS